MQVLKKRSMALSTNWWDIVKMPPSFNLEMRSCFICGDMSIGNKTTRDMASLKLVVEDQESWIKGHTIHTCMRNIFEESNKQQAELPFDERTMACCFQCNTWLDRIRERKHPLTPIICLIWYFSQLKTISMKKFDSRVIHRISRSLAMVHNNTRNYYMTVLPESEQKVITALSQTSVENTRNAVCLLFHSLNLKSIFFFDAEVADLIRKAYKAASKKTITN